MTMESAVGTDDPAGLSVRTGPAGRATALRVAVDAVHAMATGSLDDFRHLIHPEATNRESIDEPAAARGAGPEAFYASSLWLRGAFAQLSFAVHETVVDQDIVVVHARMSGVHSGDFVTYGPDTQVRRAFAPTGKRFNVTQTHWQRIRDGQVTEHWANRDDQGMAMQAGWIPPSPLYLVRCARATAKARRQH